MQVNMFDDIFFFLLEEGTDIIGIVQNIKRGQYNLALTSLLEVIPELPSILDTIVTNLHYLSEFTNKVAIETLSLIHI